MSACRRLHVPVSRSRKERVGDPESKAVVTPIPAFMDRIEALTKVSSLPCRAALTPLKGQTNGFTIYEICQRNRTAGGQLRLSDRE